jgi:hypothetical protein
VIETPLRITISDIFMRFPMTITKVIEKREKKKDEKKSLKM